MKKYNYILIMVMAFAMTLTSCSQKEDIAIDDNGTRTAQVEFSLSKAQLMKSGALVSQNEKGAIDEIIYCDEDLADEGMVTLKYDVIFDEGGGAYNLTEQTAEFWYNTTNTDPSAAGYDPSVGISGLIQFDFPSGENAPTTATLTITEAYIGGYDDPSTIGKETGQTFLAPKEGSPFADYVDNPVGKEWTIELYKKTYVKAEVLCFNKQAVALFGYTWFDFEILTGEEVCVFFNCLGTTRESYHQVYAVEIDAYMYEGDSYSSLYWEGDNYDQFVTGSADYEANVKAMCIPMPGNWADYGVELELTPLGSSESKIRISLTVDQIQDFLDENITTTTEIIALTDENYAYGLDLDFAGDARYLHYTMEDCQKPMMYYSNNPQYNASAGGTSSIYGINVSGGVVYPTLIAELENSRAHIAVTPDETTLIAVNEYDPQELILIDIYTMEQTRLEGGRVGPPMEGMPNYRFVQLVYIDDQLYAGCQSNNCLVPVDIDIENNTFTFGEDLIDGIAMELPEDYDISGADIIASKASISPAVHNGNIIYSLTNTSDIQLFKYIGDGAGAVVEETYSINYPSRNDAGVLTGAAFNYKANDASAVTSFMHLTSRDISFYLWKDGTYTELTYPDGVSLSGFGGDMASSWNNTLDEDAVSTIFGITPVTVPVPAP